MSTRAQGERALDMLGATNNELLELLGSMVGLTIGEKEANIFYIQDSGQKKVGRCYIDNTNMKLYRCIAATTSTSNTTANFTEINLLNHSDRLDNLIKVVEITVPASGRNRHVTYINSSQNSTTYYFYEYAVDISPYISGGRMIAVQPYNFRGYVEGVALNGSTNLMIYQFDIEANPTDIKIRVVYTPNR